MSDPRETLNHGTIARVTTKALGEVMGLYPRTTYTHPDELRFVQSQFGGGYQKEEQTPVAEGELIIYYYQEFGIRIAELYVGVDISGTLEWRQVHFYNYATNRDTGERA